MISDRTSVIIRCSYPVQEKKSTRTSACMVSWHSLTLIYRMNTYSLQFKLVHITVRNRGNTWQIISHLKTITTYRSPFCVGIYSLGHGLTNCYNLCKYDRSNVKLCFSFRFKSQYFCYLHTSISSAAIWGTVLPFIVKYLYRFKLQSDVTWNFNVISFLRRYIELDFNVT